MLAKVGIDKVVFAKRGTALTTPVDYFALGLVNSATLDFEHFEPIEDWAKRKFRNMLKAKFSGKTIQPDMLMLKKIIGTYLSDYGADVEITATPQTSGQAASGGIFQFFGNNFMGIDFNWIMSNKERTLEVIGELALEYPNMQALIDASDSNTAINWAGITNNGIDVTRQKFPYLDFPDSLMSGFGKEEVVEYSLSIKVVGDRSLYERLQADYLDINVEFVLKSAAVPDLVTMLNYSQMPAFSFKQFNNATNFEKFIFNSNTLTCTHAFHIGTDKRTAKVMFNGYVPLSKVSFDLGATAGGDAGQTGVGGTMTISA